MQGLLCNEAAGTGRRSVRRRAAFRSAARRLAQSSCECLPLELSVCIFPFRLRRDGFHGVPVFGNLVILDAEQVKKRGMLAPELAFTDHQHEVPFSQHLVDPLILHRDLLFCHRFQRKAQAGQLVADLRIVLNIALVFTMAETRLAGIQAVHYAPGADYRLDLEVFSGAQLRRRVADEYLGLTQRIDFYMLICVTEGSFTHTVDFEPIACRPGSLMTLRPAQVQQFDVTAQWDGWLVIFRPEFLFALGSLALADGVKVHNSLDSLPTHLQLNGDELGAALQALSAAS